tara:strand:- start:366 stop:533 length:168 start_codon:yes stop_codon:yes gene_type:complete
MAKDDWIVENLIKKGSINIMNVAHDDWCDLLKDRSKECNCSPDVSVNTLEKKNDK